MRDTETSRERAKRSHQCLAIGIRHTDVAGVLPRHLHGANEGTGGPVIGDDDHLTLYGPFETLVEYLDWDWIEDLSAPTLVGGTEP